VPAVRRHLDRVRALAVRWRDLVEQFTGGDPGIRASLQKMYDNEGAERASRGMVAPGLMAYMSTAIGRLDTTS
jgi:TipAS antibiotic-recognition protein